LNHVQNKNYWTYEEIHTTENFKREQNNKQWIVINVKASIRKRNK